MSDLIKELSELRLSYQRAELLEETLEKTPHQQFLNWFNHALSINLHEPYAMYVATANAQGAPHVRTLLLRGATEQGYDFYTNYQSVKGVDLAQNPQAELLFYWAELEQQIRISGSVSKISEQESTAYYHKRPKDNQIAAHISTPQSGVIDSRQTLQQRFDQRLAEFSDTASIPKPEFWGGYRLLPSSYEFWQGRPNRLHDRIAYRLEAGQWQIDRLMP